MKKILAGLVFLAACLSASAQTLKWTYPVNPAAPWNLGDGQFGGLLGISDESVAVFTFAPDGTGGGVFVFGESMVSGTNESGPIGYGASRVVWLNRAGKAVYDSANDNAFSPIPVQNAPSFNYGVQIIKVTSNQLYVLCQFSQGSQTNQSFVDFTRTSTGIKNQHIPTSPTAAVLLHPSTSDPTGFFVVDKSGAGYSISRYSYAVPK